MSLNAKRNLVIGLTVLLALLVGVAAFLGINRDLPAASPTEPSETSLQATEATEVLGTEAESLPTETAAPTETVAPTEPTETQPKEQRYTLSFTGDCTLGSIATNWNNSNHFIKTIGENYDYPFDNVREYFEQDDFTIINLEGPLTDTSSGAASKRFSFRGPTAYTQIMTGSSVEAVTLANNHAEDYGKAGYESTTKVLSEAGITFVEKNKTALHTTESGLVIGLYAAAFDFDTKDIEKDLASLRSQGAEIIICAFHWGEEGHYRPDGTQQKVAKAAIDAGADVVYGHHPHVLQPVEQYGSGYIFYSLGNFSFGGAALPQDYDTVLLQLDVIRDENGKVSLGELTAIPCTYRNSEGHNSFQPTPLEEGTEYDRIMKKLGGTFTGGNLTVDYSKLEPKPDSDSSSSSSGSDNTDTGNSDAGTGSGGNDAGAGSGESDAGAGSGGSDAGAGSGGNDAGAGSGGSDAGAGSGGSDAGTGSGGSDAGAGSGGSDAGAGSGSSDAGAEGA